MVRSHRAESSLLIVFIDSSVALASSTPTTTMRFLLFSGSQSPLAVRYPRPAKSTLVLPPFVHRALHTALDQSQPSATVEASTDALLIPNPSALAKHTFGSGDEAQYEATVKIQLTEARTAQGVVDAIKDALQVLAQSKGLTTIDVILLGLPEDVDGERCGSD
jgi:hypothetical protein